MVKESPDKGHGFSRPLRLGCADRLYERVPELHLRA
jgi:hypothetical protein